jgi:hypothetical protein
MKWMGTKHRILHIDSMDKFILQNELFSSCFLGKSDPPTTLF